MKYDFLKRNTNHSHVKEIPPGECDCVNCQKSRLYENQLLDRAAPFYNGVLSKAIVPQSEHFKFSVDKKFSDNPLEGLNYADADPRIGKSVKSSVDQPRYHEPGQAPYHTTKKGLPLGKVLGFNTKGNWMKVSTVGGAGYDWVSFTKPENFTFRDAAKIDGGVLDYAPVTIVPPELREGSKIVAEKGVTVIENAFSGLKWLVIAILVIAAIYFYMQFKKG